MASPAYYAALKPDETALIWAPTHATALGASPATMTWRELRERIVATANRIHDLGIGVGDSIAFCVENRLEFVVLVWACYDAGYRFTPVPTRLTPTEVAYIVADCGASLFVYSDETAGSLATVQATVPGIHTLTIDAVTAPATRSENGSEPRYERAEGIAMLYSSGSTGRPKGVWRPAPLEPIDEPPPGGFPEQASMLLDDSEGAPVYLSVAPLYHAAPLTFLTTMMRFGVTTVVMDRFDAVKALDAMQRYGVTHTNWVPTMFVRMLQLDEATRQQFDLSKHRWAIHGAGPCTIEVKQAMLDWWGPIIYEYYGGTEGAGMCQITAAEWLSHKGSVGRSMRGRIHILDENGNDLGPGETGEIWFEGSSDFQYLNDPDKTATARGKGGLGTFGDIGYVDEDGYLYLTDRKSFMIISGGVNVYPREVELVLLGHPAVRDVVVFGVPNEEWGEEVRAVVELEPGVEGTPQLEAELISYCRDHIAAFKAPRSITFTDEIPREPTGKILVPKIRALFR